MNDSLQAGIAPPEYQHLLERISDANTQGRVRAVQAVNAELIDTYWRIGQHIVEYEQEGKARADYGAALINRLVNDLTLRHGKGFSRANLIRIRQFYLTYPKGATPSHLLSWSHIVELLKIDDPLGRLRCTKLSYLFHRHAERVAEGYLKKAAGPYNPAVKYKGPEGIAQKNGYVRSHRCGNYSGFVAADKIELAERYFDRWYGRDVLNWLEQFRMSSNDELERGNAAVNLAMVKSVIRDHPEWKAKLKREIFSDANIERAIRQVRNLFPVG